MSSHATKLELRNFVLATAILAACSAPPSATNKPNTNSSGGAGAGGGGGSVNPSTGGGAGTPPGSGGVSGSGGTGLPGGGMAGAGGGTVVTCNISVTSSMLSPDIATVGIVEFSSDLAGATAAVIQFGPTTAYGLEAPVDLAAPGYRTLLLGMIQDTEYHYRIVVSGGGNTCMSADQTITTGFLPNGGPSDMTPDSGPSTTPITNGFIVTSIAQGDPWIYIINQDGQLVWSYNFDVPSDNQLFPGITRARISWDGKYMFGRDLNVEGNTGAGRIFRVGMDGSDMQVYDLDTSHHDFTVTPNGVAYLSKQGSSGINNQLCDAIWTMSTDGTGNTMVYDLWNALSTFDHDTELGELCHANSIDYIESSNSFTVSDLYRDTILKVSAAGALQWSLGGTDSTFSGTNWNKQHGHHLFADNQIVIFVNGDTDPSRVVGYALDTGAMTATQNFAYSPGANSRQMGDIQRLPDGNTLITVSVSGEMHLVDPAQQLIRSFSADSFGYAEFRTSLYGPPTRR